MQTFVPKNRRAKFDVSLRLHDLNNVPLVSGHAYIKWHIEGSTRADCRSRTGREPIKEHKVMWHYTSNILNLRLNIGKGNMLQELYIVFEVHQEYAGSRERIQLGTVRLNLAEYAGLGNETRRYLMQESKINSTVKIGIEMHQVGGDSYFVTPPLKGAQVFSGIAGIVGEQRDADDARHIPVVNSKTRETGATQDMYRRTLAASWQLVPGELNADECIEDIFGGGDGWTSGSGRKAGKSVIFDPGRREASDSDSLSQLSAGASTPTTTTSTTNEKPMASLLAVEPIKYGSVKKKGYALSIMTGRSKFAAHAGVKAQPKEIDEYEARDDLMSWRMPGIRLTKR